MNALIIANTQIRCDATGRYCLNDLHQASGGAARHRPALWLRSKQVAELIAEVSEDCTNLCSSATVETSEGFGGGTYAVKELVYAYAMWISAKFHLHVIRAYDALVTGQVAAPPEVPQAPQHRADVLVSAARGFNALVRAGRTVGLSRIRAVRSANAATFRATGIDLVAELEADDVLVEAAPLALADPSQSRLLDWLKGRAQVTTREVIADVLGGDPENRAQQMRAAELLRLAGWVPVRHATAGGTRARVYVCPLAA